VFPRFYVHKGLENRREDRFPVAVKRACRKSPFITGLPEVKDGQPVAFASVPGLTATASFASDILKQICFEHSDVLSALKPAARNKNRNQCLDFSEMKPPNEPYFCYRTACPFRFRVG
jgi:hypothetical protein